MKTIQMFKSNIHFLLVALVALVSLTACNKDEDVVNPENAQFLEANASYEYYTRFYVINETTGSLSSLGSDTDDDGVMRVKVLNDDRIEFYEDGELMFVGSNLQDQGTGFTFDFQQQEVEDPDLGIITLQGYDHYREFGGEVSGLYAYTGDYMNVALKMDVDGLELILLMDFSKVE
ncbi:MAG: hypothetical protein AAGI23_23000 [Bacteroidota bacterium]